MIRKDKIKNLKHKISCVYKIKFIDGTFYIGSTIDLRRRMLAHLCKINKKATDTFYGTLKTYEIEGVYILKIIEDKKKLRRSEFLTIRRHKNNKNLLNLPNGHMPCGDEMIKLFKYKMEQDGAFNR